MKSFEDLLASLQCPYCGDRLTFSSASGSDALESSGFGRFGVLTCRCRRYPVIDDIPVLMKGRVGIISHWNDGVIHPGPTPDELVGLLERGQCIDALIRCLIFPRTFPGQGRLKRLGLWPSALGEQAGLALSRRGLRRLSGLGPVSGEDIYAEDVFRFFYSRRSGNNTYLSEYFLNRFVMPRYLSTMALVQRLAPGNQPVLDVACGYGHIEHYLTRRQRATAAVGIDFNFYQLWGARRFVAPAASYVCCDASVALPFRAGSFGAAICSDAFMLMPDKALLAAEIERVAPGRPAIYARVGNVDVGPPNPRAGGELRPAGYHELFGVATSRCFTDSSLWKLYLERANPLAEPAPSMKSLRWEKYLSFVVHPEGLTADGEPDGSWCHGIGRLSLNTTIDVTAVGTKTIETEFMYQTAWGGYEDSDMMAYTERWGSVDRQQLKVALAEPGSAAAQDLVRRFVLVGVPDRYVRDRLPALAMRPPEMPPGLLPGTA